MNKKKNHVDHAPLEIETTLKESVYFENENPLDDHSLPLFSVKSLSVASKPKYIFHDEKHGQSSILNDINFDVFKDSFVAVVGDSGSGKSLLLYSILNLLPEKDWTVDGNVLYNNIPVNMPNDHFQNALHNDISIIFQEPASYFNPSMKIWKQICEKHTPKLNFSHEFDDLAKKMQDVKIIRNIQNEAKDFLTRYPHQFSQGQQQRLMWTLTLYPQKLLIADEPTASLDTTIQKEIITLLKNRRELGVISSMLLFTHDLRLVKALLTEPQDRVYFFHKDENGFNTCSESFTPETIFNPETDTLPEHVIRKINIAKKVNIRKTDGTDILMDKPNHIHIQNLKQSYKHGSLLKMNTVLEIKELEIKFGETVSIVGESGCGKSTLARAIARLLHHTDKSSNIFYFSSLDQQMVDLVAIQPHAYKDTKHMHALRSEIQIIFQDSATSVNPEMTLFETFNDTINLLQDSSEWQTLFDHFSGLGLADTNKAKKNLLNKYPHELSAGQRQRLALARALIMQPKLLILDEPFTNVDKTTVHYMIKLIKDIQHKYSMTCLIISHDLSLVLETSNRVIVMNTDNGVGSVYQMDTPENLVRNPLDYTKTLLDSIQKI